MIFINEMGEGHSAATWISALGIIIAVVSGILHSVWLKRPLFAIRELISNLTKGKMPAFKASKANDEIGELERNLEMHIANLHELAAFARSMSAGDFAGKLDKLSNEDELGEAMLSLQSSLMASLKESESRRVEDQHRTWSAQGLAKFSTLFREVEDDLSELSTIFIKELVGYTEADVGAMFIAMEGTESGEMNLMMYGSYAFDREKYIHRSFDFGEGLVGRAAVEKETIFLTDLPPEHMKIRSGLGEDNPASVLLVPVLLDNRVLGVIEMASLGEIPAYQIEFIRSLSDALAATLAKVKANLQTRQLFEQTKKQAEELASQEEVFKKEVENLRKAKP